MAGSGSMDQRPSEQSRMRSPRLTGMVVYSGSSGKGKPMARLVPLEAAPKKRRLGLFKGQLNVPDDFDAPLPEDVRASFEGR